MKNKVLSLIIIVSIFKEKNKARLFDKDRERKKKWKQCTI